MSITLKSVGTFTTGIFDDSAAEILAHDPTNQLLFVVNGADGAIDVLDISNPANPVRTSQLAVDNPNSVAVKNGIVAVASANDVDDQPGTVVFFDADTGSVFGSLGVGVLPDSLAFTPDGNKVIVANEGEPTDTSDPLGSISIIDISGGIAGATVSDVDFSVFDPAAVQGLLDRAGVRIFPENLPSQDIEPEYVTVSPDSSTAFVTLQENNAVAVVDLATNTLTNILPLGTVDHSVEGNGLDPSDEDGEIDIRTIPVEGLRMADAIAAFEIDGALYFATANEGDARDEDARIGDLTLDPTAFPNAAELQQDENLGRLEVSTIDGDIDGDGDFDQLFSYGSRSFTIFDKDGNVVFDSGDDFEQIIAERFPEIFNSNNDDNDSFDSRSDAKGPEPEAITVGEVGDKLYAFIGLERQGGVMIYDITDPANASFVDYVASRDFTADAETPEAGDLGPEGLVFISAHDSPTNTPLLAVANEVSGTTSIFAVTTPIYDIQGEGHISTFAGQTVNTSGVVTAVAFNGFYLQDPDGDGNDATSDGIFVFTGASGDKPEIGDSLLLSGDVSEFIPGGADTGNLSTTQISNAEFTILTSDNELPVATVIGLSGRVPPAETVISADELPVNLQNAADDAANTYDPDQDAIDFYESLEGMLVTIEEPVAVSPTRVFSAFSSEFFTLPNNGEFATPDDVRTERGGINLASGPDNTGDQNPERVQVQFDPDLFGNDPLAITVGDQLSDVTGVVGYSFGNYEVNVTEDFVIKTPSQIEPEVTTLTGTNDQLTVASYNVLNLSPDSSDDTQRELLADQIVNNLGSPDIIAVQEIQDNSGEADDGVTAADQTLQALVDAIASVGGPVYSFIDFPPEDGTSGGVPGGNIRNVYLYNADRVDVSSNTISLTSDALADAGVSNPNAFEGTRDPLAVTFSFNGEDITVINNHFSSRFGSTPVFGGPQLFIQAAEEDREAQAQALNEYVDSLLADDPDASIMVVGDLNTFEFTDDLTQILPGSGDEQVLTNLVTAALEDDNAYSFIFDGNSQVLDHMFVTDGLLETAEFDIVHVNNDFTRDDSGIFFDQTVASDHEPLIGRFTLEEQTMENFTLQILHASDLEGGVDAIDNAPNFAAIVDAFEAEADADGYTSILLSAGDNYIPGPFFNAAQFIGDDIFNETYAALFADDLAANPDIVLDTGDGRGNVDIAIANILGFDASAVGNHEFDNGPDAFAGLIGSSVDGNTIESFGALFPYLSTNLDFSGEPALAGLATDAILPSTDFQQLPSELVATAGGKPQIANATTIEADGETIGVVGATTQLVETISSTGNVTDRTGGQNDMAALAAVLQPQVDALTGSGVDKVIIVSHLQQFALEQELATLMSGVDVIIAGGSDTISADATDRLDSGDTADQPYPFVATGADGNPTAIVSTDGEYSYVGRLVVEFDENGVIIPGSIDENISGAYVTDDQGVTDVTGALTIEDAIAGSTKATLVDNLTSAVQEQVIQSDGTVFGETAVYLDGRRESVRTEETNFGNLTADANLAAVKSTDPSVVVSLKNGGGIRAPIGEIDGDTGELLPPQANAASGKLEGQISELDIQNALRFNNELTLLTLTAAELALIMEHAVAASGPGNTPGQFPQVGGLSFSFDETQQAVEFDENGNVVTEGQRIQSLAITDEDGNVSDVIVQDGEVQGDANREIRIVTLNFLADGGDGYPFNIFGEDRVDTGIGEQQALSDFLEANFPIGGPAFNEAETDPANDTRIQNLAFREDTVLDDVVPDDAIIGTDKRDFLFGTRDDDTILGEGGNDFLIGRKGDDMIEGGDGRDKILGGRGDDILDGGDGRDYLYGGKGDDVLTGGADKDYLTGGRGSDLFIVTTDTGADIILDFDEHRDQLDLSAFNFASIDDAKAAADQKWHGVIFDLEGGNTVHLKWADLDQLDEDNLIIGTQTDAIV